jgi:hypothetical protein
MLNSHSFGIFFLSPGPADMVVANNNGSHRNGLGPASLCRAYLAREIRALIKLTRYLNRTNVEIALERRKAC